MKEREAGETKWNFRKLLKYAFEGIMAYTDMPLKLPFYLAAFSFVLGSYVGKIHTQVKDRPIYIAKEILSYDKHD